MLLSATVSMHVEKTVATDTNVYIRSSIEYIYMDRVVLENCTVADIVEALPDELIEGLSNISELHLTGNKQLTSSISTRYSFIILGIYH